MKVSEDKSGETAASVSAYRYLVYLPDEYADSDAEWPLLLFLHGMGERGTVLTDIARNGPLKRVEDGAEFGFMIVAPQCPANSWWQPDTLLGLLDDVAKKYRVDACRVYVTGISMGGSGTWAVANASPERFAAIAPVCGFFTPGDPSQWAQLPIWCFHGARDEVVPATDTERMAAWIRGQGGSVRTTIYPEAEHNCWRQVYSSTDVYDWLLAHTSVR